MCLYNFNYIKILERELKCHPNSAVSLIIATSFHCYNHLPSKATGIDSR